MQSAGAPVDSEGCYSWVKLEVCSLGYLTAKTGILLCWTSQQFLEPTELLITHFHSGNNENVSEFGFFNDNCITAKEKLPTFKFAFIGSV